MTASASASATSGRSRTIRSSIRPRVAPGACHGAGAVAGSPDHETAAGGGIGGAGARVLGQKRREPVGKRVDGVRGLGDEAAFGTAVERKRQCEQTAHSAVGGVETGGLDTRRGADFRHADRGMAAGGVGDRLLDALAQACSRVHRDRRGGDRRGGRDGIRAGTPGAGERADQAARGGLISGRRGGSGAGFRAARRDTGPRAPRRGRGCLRSRP